MKKPDCYYYAGGYCGKGLSFTPCEIEGCVCYTPSPNKKAIKVVNEMLGKTSQPPVQFKPYELTLDDIRQIIHIHREVLLEYSNRIMDSQENFEETLRRFNQWKEGQK